MSDKLKLKQVTPAHTNNATTKSADGDPLPGDCCVTPPGGGSGDPGPGGPTP
ncbi:MAG TPA: hypothetical protein VGM86_09620 [Thermoanaerobaculia bacterium]